MNKSWSRTYKVMIVQLLLINAFLAFDKLTPEIWLSAIVLIMGQGWFKSHRDKVEGVE